MALHMDGARLFHALAATGHSPAELTWRAGVDVLSLGMSKCGGLFGEVVIAFSERLEHRGAQREDFKRRRRRGGQTLGKMRFVSAQLLALLEQDRWRQEAQHANSMARQLASVLETAAVRVLLPVQTNQVFCELADDVAQHLRRAGWQFKDWPAVGANGRRFVTSSLTRLETMRALADDLVRPNC
jgi:threonine aldolase